MYLEVVPMVYMWILVNSEACKEPLGLQNGEIGDDQITASSSYVGLQPYYGRLYRIFGNKVKGWCKGSALPSLWWQVDLGTLKEVTGIAIQVSDSTSADRVTSFNVQYDTDGSGNLITIKDEAGDDKIFDTSILTRRDQVAIASWDMIPMRTIRIVILSWAGVSCCLRAEILGCLDRGKSKSKYTRFFKDKISYIEPMNGNDDMTSTNLECVQMCIDVQNCVAVNYFTDTGLCELLPVAIYHKQLVARPNCIHVYVI